MNARRGFYSSTVRATPKRKLYFSKALEHDGPGGTSPGKAPVKTRDFSEGSTGNSSRHPTRSTRYERASSDVVAAPVVTTGEIWPPRMAPLVTASVNHRILGNVANSPKRSPLAERPVRCPPRPQSHERVRADAARRRRPHATSSRERRQRTIGDGRETVAVDILPVGSQLECRHAVIAGTFDFYGVSHMPRSSRTSRLPGAARFATVRMRRRARAPVVGRRRSASWTQ